MNEQAKYVFSAHGRNVTTRISLCHHRRPISDDVRNLFPPRAQWISSLEVAYTKIIARVGSRPMYFFFKEPTYCTRTVVNYHAQSDTNIGSQRTTRHNKATDHGRVQEEGRRLRNTPSVLQRSEDVIVELCKIMVEVMSCWPNG